MCRNPASKLLSLFKPKFPKYREPNEKNAQGSSRTINFHLRWGVETLKSKKIFKILQTRFGSWPHVQIILHANAKVRVFADCLYSHFNVRSFTNRFKSWSELRRNNLHYHFCLESPKRCFKPVICRQSLVESATSLPVFAAAVGSKLSSPESLRTLYSFILHSEAT